MSGNYERALENEREKLKETINKYCIVFIVAIASVLGSSQNKSQNEEADNTSTPASISPAPASISPTTSTVPEFWRDSCNRN